MLSAESFCSLEMKLDVSRVSLTPPFAIYQDNYLNPNRCFLASYPTTTFVKLSARLSHDVVSATSTTSNSTASITWRYFTQMCFTCRKPGNCRVQEIVLNISYNTVVGRNISIPPPKSYNAVLHKPSLLFHLL